jgi:hypothetical protein
MDETEEKKRSSGARYPGASLEEAAKAVALIDELGRTVLIGTLAAKLGKSETNSEFVRLVASMRSYGLADWGTTRNTLTLTADGEAVAQGATDARLAALQAAVVRPEVFRTVAVKFEGRALPQGDGLVEAFKLAGVGTNAAGLAARNFADSLAYAGLLEEMNGRKVLQTDLPYPSNGHAREEGPRPIAAKAPATTAVARAMPGRPALQLPQPRPQGLGQVQPAVGSWPPPISFRFDVSGWTPEQVADLIKRLRDQPT